MDGGDGDGVPQAQGIELINGRVLGPGGVRLVDGQHHGLPGAQQHVGHVLIRGGDPGADVGDQDDDGGRIDGDLGLFPHEQQNFAVGAGLNAAGVHHVKLSAAPLALGVQPVPGDAGRIFHNAQPLAHQAVKEHGLSHVGATYYSNKRS